MPGDNPVEDLRLALEQFFSGCPEAWAIFTALWQSIDAIGPAQLRVSKSQVAFSRHRVFAMAWRPGQYLQGKLAPLVLTVALRRHDSSPRWKQIVEPSLGRFTHHLELFSSNEIDDQVRAWLIEAWQLAG